MMSPNQTIQAKELAPYNQLSDDVKSAVLALSVLISRINRLPVADRDDLFELLQEWRKTGDPEETASIQRAMEEILAQTPITSSALPLGEKKPFSGGLDRWAKHAGKKIRELREGAGLNQTQLAEKAGLTQSHISRIENAEHSATNFTLEKIAKALGIAVGDLDPCAD